MEKYIAYYRVSTNKQELGIKAQKKQVSNFIEGKNIEIIASFEEKESGKNDNRPELKKALELCKEKGAALLIAKLDRLSRNLTFISQLQDDKIKFVALDMPEANNFTINIMAALAQQERQLISERTKAALAVKKANGVKLGKPENLTNAARMKGVKTNQNKARTNENNIKARKVIQVLRKQGLSYNKIAMELNESKFKTSNNKSFTAMQVKRLFEV